MDDVRLAWRACDAEVEIADFSVARRDLSLAVGASDTIQRGNIFKSYAAFHFDTFVCG